MHYLFIIFFIAGEGSGIHGYKEYQARSFSSMEECVTHYEESKDEFIYHAQIGSNGRLWEIACVDQDFKDNIEQYRIPVQESIQQSKDYI